VKW
jgi:hypothetical protein